MEQNHSLVIVAFSPCKQLNNVHWTFWRNNSLILLPQAIFIANSLQLNINSRVYHLDTEEQLLEIYQFGWQKIQLQASGQHKFNRFSSNCEVHLGQEDRPEHHSPKHHLHQLSSFYNGQASPRNDRLSWRIVWHASRKVKIQIWCHWTGW